jgi:dolichol-phosphate mannosyltransferase
MNNHDAFAELPAPNDPASLLSTLERVAEEGWHTPQNPQGRRILIALPAYNEAEAISPLLERIIETMMSTDRAWRVIVVDDGSKDETVRLAKVYSERYPVEVIRHRVNSGLGAALNTCFREAVARCNEDDCIVLLDADNTQPPELIPQLAETIESGKDVVIASRFQKGANVRGVPAHRNLLSVGARFIFTTAFPISGVRDYTCGFRIYRAGVLADALTEYGDRFVSESGFSCMVDVLLKLRGRGLKFAELPIDLRYDQKGGVSKMKVLSTIGRTLGLVARRRFSFGKSSQEKAGRAELLRD